MTFGGERAAVQNPFIRYVEEAGWTHLSSGPGAEPATRPHAWRSRSAGGFPQIISLKA